MSAEALKGSIGVPGQEPLAPSFYIWTIYPEEQWPGFAIYVPFEGGKNILSSRSSLFTDGTLFEFHFPWLASLGGDWGSLIGIESR